MSDVQTDGPGRYMLARSPLAVVLRRVLAVAHERGWGYLWRLLGAQVWSRVSKPFGYLFCRLRPEKTFTVAGRTYAYFYRWYNQTWRNERAVEVPLIWSLLQSARDANVLEVGNVLSHFFTVKHVVVDKFERAPGVLNCDIIDHAPPTGYDLIVSISTLEHVGWDERPLVADKALRVIGHLQQLLRPGGRLVYTIPIGYNAALDAALREGLVTTTARYALKRISRDNRWREVAWDTIAHAAYGEPYPAANAIVVCEFRRPEA